MRGILGGPSARETRCSGHAIDQECMKIYREWYRRRKQARPRFPSDLSSSDRLLSWRYRATSNPKLALFDPNLALFNPNVALFNTSRAPQPAFKHGENNIDIMTLSQRPRREGRRRNRVFGQEEHDWRASSVIYSRCIRKSLHRELHCLDM